MQAVEEDDVVVRVELRDEAVVREQHLVRDPRVREPDLLSPLDVAVRDQPDGAHSGIVERRGDFGLHLRVRVLPVRVVAHVDARDDVVSCVGVLKASAAHNVHCPLHAALVVIFLASVWVTDLSVPGAGGLVRWESQGFADPVVDPSQQRVLFYELVVLGEVHVVIREARRRQIYSLRKRPLPHLPMWAFGVICFLGLVQCVQQLQPEPRGPVVLGRRRDFAALPRKVPRFRPAEVPAGVDLIVHDPRAGPLDKVPRLALEQRQPERHPQNDIARLERLFREQPPGPALWGLHLHLGGMAVPVAEVLRDPLEQFLGSLYLVVSSGSGRALCESRDGTSAPKRSPKGPWAVRPRPPAPP
mmetsp:Transcript_6826/g.16752  ORF Transcript_6826/g.16752 Transcript_6826/m.16752 type:complete len:358 (-) Transcript_6826:494-1567(-)